MQRRHYLGGIAVATAGALPGTATAWRHGWFTVSIVDVHDEVTGGERLDVDVRVFNTSFRSRRETVSLLVGSDRERVDERLLTLGGRSAQVLRLGFQTYPVRQTVTFEVEVRSRGESDVETVTVYGTEDPGPQPPGPGTLDVTITHTGDPVTGGQNLSVTATVRNTGSGTVTETVSLVVSDETVDTESVTLAAGATQTVTLVHPTYPVRQTVQFPVTVQGGGDSATRTVTVHGTG